MHYNDEQTKRIAKLICCYMNINNNSLDEINRATQKHAMAARSSWLCHASSLLLLGGVHLAAGAWIALGAESSLSRSFLPSRACPVEGGGEARAG